MGFFDARFGGYVLVAALLIVTPGPDTPLNEELSGVRCALTLLHIHCLLQDLLSLLPLLVSHWLALLVSDLSQQFIRVLHLLTRLSTPAGSLGHAQPTSTASSRKSGMTLCPFTSAKHGVFRTQQLITCRAPQPLERHLHTSKACQQHSPLHPLAAALPAPIPGTLFLLLFGDSNGLLKGFGSLTARPASSI